MLAWKLFTSDSDCMACRPPILLPRALPTDGWPKPWLPQLDYRGIELILPSGFWFWNKAWFAREPLKCCETGMFWFGGLTTLRMVVN